MISEEGPSILSTYLVYDYEEQKSVIQIDCETSFDDLVEKTHLVEKDMYFPVH